MAVMRQHEEDLGSSDNVLVFVFGDVPERWKERARPAHFIPLLPSESSPVLSAAGRAGLVEPEDDVLLRLAARGAAARVIARTANLSIRTVHRRLARLRDQFGVESSAELAAELSRRGFGQ